MQSPTETAPVSRTKLWAGRVISALPALLLLFSGVVKLMKVAPVVRGFAHLGFPAGLMITIGILEVGCTVVYLIPRTAVLGAILMTGYMGGATAANVRVGDAWIPPVVVAVLVWSGLVLRDERVRALIPLRNRIHSAT